MGLERHNPLELPMRCRPSFNHLPSRFRLLAGAALLAALFCAGTSQAQISDPLPDIPVGDLAVRVEFVAQLPPSGIGTARPMTLTGDGSGRIFVADQNGEVLQLHPGGSVSTFLDLSTATPLQLDHPQRGLNSFAFHPDYHVPGRPGTGKFYTTSSQPIAAGPAPVMPVPAGAPTAHHTVIHEWTVSADPDAIDPASAREVLRIAQPYGDHNVGQISFDPDPVFGDPDYGLLYIASGDGGNTGCCPWPVIDPHFTGQDLSSPLGAMLRIDPLEPVGGGATYSVPASNPFATDGDPLTLAEIWAYGLRNPHRFSWDRGGAKRMFISNIGQGEIEEIELGQLGANYGWSEREGTFATVHTSEDIFPLPPDDALYGYTYPVLQYDHDEDDRAISGGYVQRGAFGSGLEGRYVFGDLRSGRIFHAPASALDGSGQAAFEVLRLIDASDDQEKTLLEMLGNAPRADLRFGMDDLGRIYLVTKRDGGVRRLVPIYEASSVPALGPVGMGALVALVAGAGAARVTRRRRR